MKKFCAYSFLAFFLIIATADRFIFDFAKEKKFKSKVYWLIPDGLRSDGEYLDLVKLSQKGYLPNIKRLLQSSIYRESKPNFPNHSAVNFASIVTGEKPEFHGILDNHIGTVRDRLKGEFAWGFDFTSLDKSPFWELYQDRAILAFMPQTPVLGGGGIHWVGDRFSSKLRRRKSFWIHFDAQNNLLRKCALEVERCQSSIFFANKMNTGTSEILEYRAMTPIGLVEMQQKGERIYFRFDNQEIVTTLGKSSNWSPNNELQIIATHFNPSLLRLRVVLSQNAILASRAKESLVTEIMRDPILDFPGNNPSALEYTTEDDAVFMQELEESVKSHQRIAKKLATAMTKDYDLVMHSLYFPNMGLTRKWRDRSVSLEYDKNKETLPDELLRIYQGVDRVIGSILEILPKGAFLIISSDHGVEQAKVDFSVNNFLVNNRFLKLKTSDVVGLDSINWGQTEAIFLKSSRVYYLNKIAEPSKKELIDRLKNLTFNNARVIQNVHELEDGLELTTQAGVRMIEDFLPNQEIFQTPSEVGGFKEALDSNLKSLQTPFIIYKEGLGKFVKKEEVISSDEQLVVAIREINEELN